jgi:hypothetical protein
MKKSNLITLLAIATLTTTALVNYSCKKDRIEEPEQLAAYEPINSYLDSKKQQEQEFIITGPSNDTILGNQGTRIYGAKNCLVDGNNDTVDYPFSIHLVELYTPKDMMYWQMPTVASGDILETDGEIRIRATKNSQELTLKPSCPYGIEMPNSAPKSYMNIFFGATTSNFVNWTDSNSPFNTIPYGYQAFINQLGWINCDNKIGNSKGHTLSFTSTTDDLTNVGIFIYFTAHDGVMQVYNTVSGLIPNGSTVKIVMMAQDSNGQLFSYTETRTVNNSDTISMSLSSTTDGALTAHLNSL